MAHILGQGLFNSPRKRGRGIFKGDPGIAIQLPPDEPTAEEIQHQFFESAGKVDSTQHKLGASLFDGFGQSQDPLTPGEKVKGLGRRVSNFLQDNPEARSALLNFGAQISQPIPRGQTSGGVVTSALAASINQLQQARQANVAATDASNLQQQELGLRRETIAARERTVAERQKNNKLRIENQAAKAKRDRSTAAQKWEENAILGIKELFTGSSEELDIEIQAIKDARQRIFGDQAEVAPVPPPLSVENVVSQFQSINPDVRPNTLEFAQMLDKAQARNSEVVARDFLKAQTPVIQDDVTATADRVQGDLFPDVPPLKELTPLEIGTNVGRLRGVFTELEAMVSDLQRTAATRPSQRNSRLGATFSRSQDALKKIGDLQATQLYIKRTLERAGFNLEE